MEAQSQVSMPESQKELESVIKALRKKSQAWQESDCWGLCSVIVIRVSKQTKPSSGSALDYKQQVPFLDEGKNVTCSNHFLKYLELVQNQVFSNDFAELVSVLTQSPGSMVFHLNSIKLCEFMCTLIFWLLHALIWLHSSWSLWAIAAMAAAWHRPDKARHAQGLPLQTLQLILLLQKLPCPVTHHSSPLPRRMLWFVVCASHPAQAEEICCWAGTANTLPAALGSIFLEQKGPPRTISEQGLAPDSLS